MLGAGWTFLNTENIHVSLYQYKFDPVALRPNL